MPTPPEKENKIKEEDTKLDLKAEEKKLEEVNLLDIPTEESQVNPFVIDYGIGSSIAGSAVQNTGKIRGIPSVFRGGTTTRKFAKLLPTFYPSGVLTVSTTATSVGGATTADTTLNSFTIPALTLSRNDPKIDNVGNVIRVWAGGRNTTDDATAAVTLKCKVGSTTYHTITSTGSAASNQPWHIGWVFVINTLGTGGTAESQVEAKINNVNKDSANTSTITINTTIDNTLAITAAWASGDAGDDISIRQFIVEILN